MEKPVQLRRPPDADGDRLTADGIRAAVEIGRSLTGNYDLLISSGAQRATQTLACLLAGFGHPVAAGVEVNSGFRSSVRNVGSKPPAPQKARTSMAFGKLIPSPSSANQPHLE